MFPYFKRKFPRAYSYTTTSFTTTDPPATMTPDVPLQNWLMKAGKLAKKFVCKIHGLIEDTCAYKKLEEDMCMYKSTKLSGDENAYCYHNDNPMQEVCGVELIYPGYINLEVFLYFCCMDCKSLFIVFIIIRVCISILLLDYPTSDMPTTTIDYNSSEWN